VRVEKQEEEETTKGKIEENPPDMHQVSKKKGRKRGM